MTTTTPTLVPDASRIAFVLRGFAHRMHLGVYDALKYNRHAQRVSLAVWLEPLRSALTEASGAATVHSQRRRSIPREADIPTGTPACSAGASTARLAPEIRVARPGRP